MLKIEKGQEYRAKRVRSGESATAPWELVVVAPEDKRMRQDVTIFADNIPSGVVEGRRFTVKDISSVVIKKAKNKDGTWGANQTSINATVEPIENAEFDDFGDLDDYLEL